MSEERENRWQSQNEEPPKRIWLDDDMEAWVQEPSSFDHWSYTVPYVRADLVEEMREALEDILSTAESISYSDRIKARAALDLLDET